MVSGRAAVMGGRARSRGGGGESSSQPLQALEGNRPSPLALPVVPRPTTRGSESAAEDDHKFPPRSELLSFVRVAWGVFT